MCNDQYNYDLLLEYLSYKKNGSWLQFKRYVKNLDYEYDELVQQENEYKKHISICNMLSNLGHVEFMFNDNQGYFAIAPSAISLLPNSYKGVLCGYRTESMLKTLKDICSNLKIKYEENANYQAPKAIFIDFQNQENIENFKLINELGIKIVENVSEKLLKIVPSARSIEEKIKSNGVKYKNIDKQSITNVYDYMGYEKYKTWSRFEVRDKITQYNSYYLYYKNRFYEVDKNYGQIINIIANNYNAEIIFKNNSLIIQNKLNLPKLMQRALVLSSGYNFKLDENNAKIYDNINEELKSLLVKKTGLLCMEVMNEE